jgi:hypothetical protein
MVGHKVQIDGLAFLPHQTLWIGSTSIPVKCADTRSIDFEVPKSLPAGQYPLFIENERGRSNAVTIQVVR